MQSRYPCPCLRCGRADSCVGYICRDGKHCWCSKYEIWFKWWWKRFRYILTNAPEKAGANKFRYSHPDHIKRYLQEGPCASCAAQAECDTPCKAYLRWYDARMEITRKKVGL